MDHILKTTAPLTQEGKTVLQNEQPKEPQYILYEVVSESQLIRVMREEYELLFAGIKADLLGQENDTEHETGETILSKVPAHPCGGLPTLSVLIPVFLLVLIAASLTYLSLFQQATVTIIPDTIRTDTSGSITIVTGTPDLTVNQLSGHMLPDLTMTQTETVTTTGFTNLPARPGKGTITFYNASMYSQPIAAGTLLTAASGVQVTTDYAVTVPAEALPTFGSVSVTAHATQTGPQGNIPANAIYGPCCLAHIQATNAAFTGGQDAASYNSVAQVDIDTAAANLKTGLIQSVTKSFQAQVQQNESLVTPVSCQPTITTDHSVGVKATQVQVRESVSCTGITYDTTAFHHLIHTMQTQAAGQQQTEHYHLLDSIQTTIQTETPRGQPGTATLTVHSIGTWAYTFSPRKRQQLATSIAGKNTQEATQHLIHIPGIRQVSVNTLLGFMPLNPQHIHVLFVIPQESPQ